MLIHAQACRRTLIFAFGLLYFAAFAHAQGPQPSAIPGLRVGQAAPNWDRLPATDGQAYAREDFRGSPLLVLVFARVNCPVSISYLERMEEFAKQVPRTSATLVAIHIGRPVGDSPVEVQALVERKKLSFPFLYDGSQAVGRAHSVQVTPTVFVLDNQRRVIYQGAWDDHMDPALVNRRYVREAVDAALQRRQPSTAETRPFGSGIRYQ